MPNDTIKPLLDPTVDEDDSAVFRRGVPPPNDEERDESVWWVASLIGASVAGLGGFVLYETLGLYAIGTTLWVQCLQAAGGALQTCGEQVSFTYDYRYGISAQFALGTALAALFLGPIPIIVNLNRYKNNIVAGILFFIVMIPYGTLAFLVLIVGVLAAIFFTIQLV